MGDLDGQLAFVSGASRGIGRAIAVAYARAGAEIVLAARSTDDLQRVADEITTAGGSATTLQLDVTDRASVAAGFDRLTTTHGGLDIVVLNAGVGSEPAGVVDSELDDWQATFDVNVFGVVACAKAAVPLLRARRGGKIIVTGSGTGHQTNPGLGVYGASKAALASVAKTLAVELRDEDIAVNELVPGPVDTAMAAPKPGADRQPSLARAGREWFKQPEDVTDLALLLARFPNNGPSGQTFSLMGRLL